MSNCAIVICFKCTTNDRLENLLFTISWITNVLPDKKLYVVETDIVKKIENKIPKHENIKYIFIYNNSYFNRGWAFNVAIKNYVTEDVIIISDADILLLSSINECANKIISGSKYFVSPYKFVYYTSTNERNTIVKTNNYDFINLSSYKPHKGVSFTGGVIVADKSKYLELGGYEEYCCYGHEDRALDVIIESMIDASKILICDDTYVHLYHKPDNINIDKQVEINKNHCKKFFGCYYDKNNYDVSNIHKFCSHPKKENIISIIESRKNLTGNENLYKANKLRSVNSISETIMLLYDNSCQSIMAEFYNNYKYEITHKYDVNNKELKNNINCYIGSKIINITSKNLYQVSSNNKIINYGETVKKSEKPKILIVMGNGPSLKDIDFNVLKQHHTFGLNAAYRAYEKLNFCPTYFGCFDYVVNESHKKEFENLVLTSAISRFYFIGNFKKKQHLYDEKAYMSNKFAKFNFNSMDPKSVKKMSTSFNDFINMGSSGANAVQVGILLGYTRIILVGCDCNYVEQVDGAKRESASNNVLKMDYTPKENPNYWFDDYQQKGDKFNLPNTDYYQMLSWENIFKFKPNNVEIFNCSPISKIKNIPKLSFEKALEI